jgi:hypothetical protein
MLQKNVDVSPIGNTKRLTVGFRCGDCLHFDKIPKFSDVCSKLGVERHSKSPQCFNANVFLLQRVNPDVLSHLGLLLSNMTPQQTRITLGLLLNRAGLDNLKLKFGQPVMFCLGDNYLSNYYRGYVISASSAPEPYVYLTSDLDRRQITNPTVLSLMPDSILTLRAFEARKIELVEADRLIDKKHPLRSKFSKTALKKPDYQPPTLESAPADWFDVFSNRSTKKRFDQNGFRVVHNQG